MAANPQPYPSEPEWWRKVFDPECVKRYGLRQRPYPDGPDSLTWSTRTAYDIAAGMTKEAALAKHMRDLDRELDLLPNQTACVRPLVGPLRKEGGRFRDDLGYRRVLADSSFNLMRMLKLHPSLFDQIVSDTVTCRYQITRTFLFVGGWSGFWDNAEVLPPWPVQKWLFSRESGHLRPAGLGPVLPGWSDWPDLFRRLCREYRQRKLRLHVTTGDVQIICQDQAQEIAFHEMAARIAAEEGGSDVIAFWEVTNEYPLNRPHGGAQREIDQMGRVIDAVKRILPDVLCTEGAAVSEEPDRLRESVAHGDLCTVHITRDPFPLCLKRSLGVQYWEGAWGALGFPFNHAEPKGMNAPPYDDGRGDDMYAPSFDPAEMTALHAMIALTGAADNYFTGSSVKLTNLNSAVWGYREIPEMLERELPEDVSRWNRETAGGGAILYFVEPGGKRFATATHESWDTAPPRSVARWRCYSGDAVSDGTGTPPRNVTGAIFGEFA